MIKFDNINFKDDKNGTILDNLSIEFEKDMITCVCGKKNSGKKAMADLMLKSCKPDSGEITIMSRKISEIEKKDLHKAVGYIDGTMDILPHMTVFQNVALPLYIENMDMAEVEDRVESVFNIMGMGKQDYGYKYPNELSDFEKNKVKIARAISSVPFVLVMDEPFKDLSEDIKENLSDEIMKIQSMLEITIVFFTSNIKQAIKLADKIAIMDRGSLVQFDKPEQILKNPKNEFVEYFLGKKRLIRKPSMFVAKDVMTKNVPTIHREQSYCQAMQIMRNYKSNFLVVVDTDTAEDGLRSMPVGIVSPKQIERAYKSNLTIGDVMRRDVKTAFENTNLSDVIKIRDDFRHNNIPVIDEHKALTGIITQTSLLNVVCDNNPDVEDIR